jgi:hypothetical protein
VTRLLARHHATARARGDCLLEARVYQALGPVLAHAQGSALLTAFRQHPDMLLGFLDQQSPGARAYLESARSIPVVDLDAPTLAAMDAVFLLRFYAEYLPRPELKPDPLLLSRVLP